MSPDPSDKQKRAETGLSLQVTGYGPDLYKTGRSVRYRRSELLKWAEARRHRNTSQYNAA